MQKLSLRKISILGLALMAASAVTAAMVPKNIKKPIKLADAGSLTDTSSVGGNRAASSITCAPDSDDQISQQACTASTGDGSATTSTRQDKPNPLSSNSAVSSANADGGAGANGTTSDNV
jgi:hypothetical protein